jgi:hypothetical protein
LCASSNAQSFSRAIAAASGARKTRRKQPTPIRPAEKGARRERPDHPPSRGPPGDARRPRTGNRLWQSRLRPPTLRGPQERSTCQRVIGSTIAGQPSVGVSGRDGEGRFEQGDGARFERRTGCSRSPRLQQEPSTIERHEGDVRTEWGGDFHQMTAERRWRERSSSEVRHRRRRFRRRGLPRPGPLVDLDREAGRPAGRFLVRSGRAVSEVLVGRSEAAGQARPPPRSPRCGRMPWS